LILVCFKKINYLGNPPLFSSHEEEVVIYYGFKSLAKEVHEVVKVLDAHALQEFHIMDEDGGTGSLINDPKADKE
jgi:hypothetical protein